MGRASIVSKPLGAGLVTCLMASCGAEVPALVFPSTPNPVQLGVARTHKGDGWSIGMEGTICLDKPGSVEVTGVSLVRPHGVRVIGFGLRPNQNWKQTAPPGTSEFLGEVRTPLRRMGYTGRTVDAVCNLKTAAGYELAVRLLKTTSNEAGAAAWKVSYVSNQGSRGTLMIPFALKLCRERSADAKSCRRSPL